MEFYAREDELELLKSVEGKSKKRSYMTLIYGRPRIGKTRLIHKHFTDRKFLYFFVSKKSDSVLARDFLEEIKKKYEIDVPAAPRNSLDILEIIVQLGKREPVNVVFDEFQDYRYVNPAIFSEIQGLWDREIVNENTRINLLFFGSRVSQMERIFLDEAEPLFGRLDNRLLLQPLRLEVLKKILEDHNRWTRDNFIDLYIFSGGIPKYIDFFIESGAATFEEFIGKIICKDSPLLEEGKRSLMEEFGEKYGTYFAILQLIAEGKTKRSEIMAILHDVKEIDGYLNVMEDRSLRLIAKHKPFDQEKSNNIRYVIDDPFYRFWFRFIYKNMAAVEAGNFDYLEKIVLEDWTAYREVMFKKFIKAALKDSLLFNRVGAYWDKNGLNEIDTAAVNDNKKYMLLGECKLNEAEGNINLLIARGGGFSRKFQSYRKIFRIFYPEMIDEVIENPRGLLYY